LGTFTNVAGSSSCTTCQQGFFCNTIALGNPALNAVCPSGYYCPSYDSITSGGAQYKIS